MEIHRNRKKIFCQSSWRLILVEKLLFEVKSTDLKFSPDLRPKSSTVGEAITTNSEFQNILVEKYFYQHIFITNKIFHDKLNLFFFKKIFFQIVYSEVNKRDADRTQLQFQNVLTLLALASYFIIAENDEDDDTR